MKGRAQLCSAKGHFTQGQCKGGHFSHHHGARRKLQKEAAALRVSAGGFLVTRLVQGKRQLLALRMACAFMPSTDSAVLCALGPTCPVGCSADTQSQRPSPDPRAGGILAEARPTGRRQEAAPG